MCDIMAHIKVCVKAALGRGQSNRGVLENNFLSHRAASSTRDQNKVAGKHSGTKYYRRTLTLG